MKKSIFKNIIFKFLLNVFNLVVPLIIGPYILRKLGPDLMGTINFSQAIFGYFFIFAGFGVYQYGLREISKVRDDKEKLESTFTSLFFMTIITNIITTLIYIFFIHSKYYGTELYISCIILTFNLLSNIFYTEWVNEALESYDFITLKTIIVRVIYVVFIFILVRSSDNFNEYLILLVLSTFLNNIISYIYVRKRIKFNFKNIKILKHIKPMFLVVILSNANVLYTQLDKVMLGEYTGTVNVAYYTMAQNISYMINAVLLTLIHVSIPRLSNYVANNEDNKYLNLLNKMSRIYLLLLFPCSIGMFLLSKEIVWIYGGSEYVSAYPLLMVFSLYIITLGYESILSNQVMYIKGYEKQQVLIIFICGVVNLILNIVMLIFKSFNGLSALVTTVIANTLVVILQQIYVTYKMKLKYNIFSLDKTKYLIISLIFIPITIIINNSINNMWIRILTVITSNALAYFIILIIIRDPIIIEIISKLLKKIKK